MGWPHTGPRGPCPREGLCGEDRDTAQCDGTGSARSVRVMLAIEAGGTQGVLRDPVRGCVGMVGQRAYSPARHLLGPRRQAAELEVFTHPLTQRGQGSTSCTWRGWDGDGQEGESCEALWQVLQHELGWREGPTARSASFNQALEPTPTASARASLRLLARLTASVRHRSREKDYYRQLLR